MLGGGGITDPDSAVLGGGGIADPDSAVVGGGGIDRAGGKRGARGGGGMAEQEESAVVGGGGMTEQEDSAVCGAGRDGRAGQGCPRGRRESPSRTAPCSAAAGSPSQRAMPR